VPFSAREGTSSNYDANNQSLYVARGEPAWQCCRQPINRLVHASSLVRPRTGKQTCPYRIRWSCSCNLLSPGVRMGTPFFKHRPKFSIVIRKKKKIRFREKPAGRAGTSSSHLERPYGIRRLHLIISTQACKILTVQKSPAIFSLF
jgi:hypothetical protein